MPRYAGATPLDMTSKEFFDDLDASLRQNPKGCVLHIDLSRAWVVCGKLKEPGRLRAALLDLQLHSVVMNIELLAISQAIHSSSPAAGDWKDSASFSVRLQLFQHATSFVMRYRAAWDKLMGIFLLL